jgi:hypothetical protein
MKYKQGVADMFISNEIGELIPIIAIPFYFFRVPTPNQKKGIISLHLFVSIKHEDKTVPLH